MMAQDTLIEPQTQTSLELPKWTAYLSCDELPLPIFIDCLLYQQYEKLVKDGNPTEDELAEVWLRIYSEYHTLSGNSSMSAIMMQVWNRDCITNKIASVKVLLSYLAVTPDERIADCIRLFGFSLPPYNGDIEVYGNHINRITAQLKGLEHEVKRAQEILDSLKGDEVTKSVFTKQLVAISRHNKYHISIKDITTAEYCEYVRTYREYVEALTNKNVEDGG